MSHLFETLPFWLWVSLAVITFFLARGPIHRSIYSLARLFHRSLLFSANAVELAGQGLRERNREVLLARGREVTEWQIEREFERIESSLKRDMAQYPTLHRHLCEQMTTIDDDYVRSAEVPPEPSSWARAIRSVAEIPTPDDTVVADVLETINHSMRKAENKALESYRESIRERHQLLKRMMPGWRSILKTLGRMNKSVESVIYRSKVLDEHMTRYEEVLQESDRSLRLLSTSFFSRFFISSLVLLLIMAGVWLNHQLIARPVAEIIGSNSFLGGYGTADIAALILIFVQIVTGIVVMECLLITRLFPSVSALTDSVRKRLLWIGVLLLLCLASIEAGLSLSRELLLQQDQLLTGLSETSGSAVTEINAYWTLGLVQMMLGFTLPLVLAFIAIPLEQFLSSARTVFGSVLVFFLNVLSVGLRLLALIAINCGTLLNRIYDLIIFLPLWLQHTYRQFRKASELDVASDKSKSPVSQSKSEINIEKEVSTGGAASV
ncbi:hypothetical protein [Microbulbifer sp. JMSA008]|uniref:hypothetical protein n=1 Tax=Microbulbifer sp. JMSA008 TaxID=3243373 RepID=UPI00403A0425